MAPSWPRSYTSVSHSMGSKRSRPVNVRSVLLTKCRKINGQEKCPIRPKCRVPIVTGGEPHNLSLRPTLIGGETAPGDYTVIWDGLQIGRIFKAAGVGGHEAWSWSVSLPNIPQPSFHRGKAASLEEAKALFRAAWTELREH